MIEKTLQADYLVVGSGAVGMAFADVLLTETDASLIIVNKYQSQVVTGMWPIRLSRCISLCSAQPLSLTISLTRPPGTSSVTGSFSRRPAMKPTAEVSGQRLIDGAAHRGSVPTVIVDMSGSG